MSNTWKIYVFIKILLNKYFYSGPRANLSNAHRFGMAQTENNAFVFGEWFRSLCVDYQLNSDDIYSRFHVIPLVHVQAHVKTCKVEFRENKYHSIRLEISEYKSSNLSVLYV